MRGEQFLYNYLQGNMFKHVLQYILLSYNYNDKFIIWHNHH